MSDRAEQLHATADGQIAQLIALLESIDEETLRLPCPGREKLGDGTVGALASHTADNYQRIDGFVHASDRISAPHQDYAANHTDAGALVAQLSATRDSFRRIADLTDGQLDAIPPKDSFRFCDGQRTLEQVVAGLLKHQSHQVDSLQTAVG